jgi:sugar lactone lactonase YvrE
MYKGIDLVYHGTNQVLEYDFEVAPQIDPKQIAIEFQAIEKLEIEENGDLSIKTSNGTLSNHKPIIYQEIDGQKQMIAGNFKLLSNDSVGFEVGSYNHNFPLIIDPTVSLAYSTFLGGSSADQGNAIAVDASGSAYVVGQTNSTNFPTINAFQPTAIGGGSDVFVTKFSATGTSLVYSTFLGGSSSDQGFGIAVDSSGNTYITGTTNSTNFPTMNAFQSTLGGSNDAFITKLSATGTSLVYSTFLGGDSGDSGIRIAIDGSGNAYVTGNTNSTDFPRMNAFQSAFGGGNSDGFTTKLSATGNSLIYSTFLGGSASDTTAEIAVDTNGNAYVIGSTQSTNFPTVNAFQSTNAGGADAFVTKFSATGSSLVYSTYLGGNDTDQGSGIVVDGNGNAYVTGFTQSTNFPTVNAFQSTNAGGADAFVTKFSATGNSLVYSTYFGGSSFEIASGIAIDGSGNFYINGITFSTNFPTMNAFQSSFAGSSDVFVTEFSATGSSLVYSTYLGGNNIDQPRGIAVDRRGNVYISGFTNSTDFPTMNAFQPTFAGGVFDGFVTKLLAFGVAPSSIDHNTIYVADTLNNRIQRSTNDGVNWQRVGNGAGTGLGQFNAPRGVAADSSDTLIFVADTNNNRIQRSTDGGTSWSIIASAGTLANQVNQPQAITYDQTNNILYVADTGNNRILKAINANATPSFSIMATAGTALGQFNQPRGIAVDSAGSVYVADTANNRIQMFTTSWTTIATLGKALGSVIGPTGVYVDAMNRIYIADTVNNRIQVASPQNNSLTSLTFSLFMSPGTTAGTVNSPQGVVYASSGNVFVGDTGNNRIQKKSINGGAASVVGPPGLSIGQFNQPIGIR